MTRTKMKGANSNSRYRISLNGSIQSRVSTSSSSADHSIIFHIQAKQSGKLMISSRRVGRLFALNTHTIDWTRKPRPGSTTFDAHCNNQAGTSPERSYRVRQIRQSERSWKKTTREHERSIVTGSRRCVSL